MDEPHVAPPDPAEPDGQPRRVGRRSVLYGLIGVAGFGVGWGAAEAAADSETPHLGVSDATASRAPAVTPQLSPQARKATTRTVSLNAADFGAVGDDRRDATSAIQAALNASRVAIAGMSGNDVPAAKVLLPAGRFKISKSLRLPANTTLEGVSPSGTYLDATGRFDAVRLAASTDVQCTVRDLGILCNGGGGGINFANQTYGPSILGDSRHVIDNVVIVVPGPRSYGLRIAGTECRINNTTIQRPAGVALYVGGTDHMIDEVTVGGGTGRGDTVVFDTSNTRTTNLKIYGSAGQLLVKGLRNTFVGVELQDTGRNGGAAFTGNETAVQGLLVDSCQNSDGPVLSVGGIHNVVQGIVIANRDGGKYTSSYALDTSSDAGHQLQLQLIGPFASRAIMHASHLAGSTVRLNTMGSTSTRTLGSGTLTPSPFQNTAYIVNGISGGVAIANPRNVLSRAGTADFFAGMTLSFHLVSAGRHALSFGSQYTLAGSAPALGRHVQIAFLYDGTTWRETSRSVS